MMVVVVDLGILFLPWFPPLNGMRAQRSSVLGRIASAHGATPGQVALAWMLRTASVTVPLPGTWNPAWEDENLAAIDLDLTAEEVRELSDLPGIGAGV